MTPPEGCARYRERIGAFVLGKLEGADLEAVQAHINGCADCWAEAMELGPVVAALADADPERIDEYPRPPGGLEESILARTAGDIPRARRRGRRFGLLTPAAAAIFASVVGLAGLTSYLVQDEPMGSSGPSVHLGPSAVDRAPDLLQELPQAVGPGGRIPPERGVKGSYPGVERSGAAPEKSAPGRGVHEPPASALPASAPASSAPPTSSAPPAASAPSQSSVPPSSAPPASASSPPPEQQYR